jgi:glycosyltransferase involved in cell wall biosynthesis
MKVVVANEHFLYWNGGARYILEVTRRLATSHQVSLIVQDISSENNKRFEDAGVEVLDMEETTANKLRYWIFYPYYLVKHALILREAQARYQFDAWISSSPTTHIMAMIAGIKPVIVVFELNPWLYSIPFRSGLSKSKQFIIKCGSILAKWLEQRAYRNATKILAHSEYIKSEIKRAYNADSTVCHAGVDSEFFHKELDAELVKKYAGKQIVLHVASYLSPMKGTDLAVQVMGQVNKEFPHALLLIVNSHNDVDRQYELLDKANECGAYLRFATSVSDEQLRALYSMATCILCTSFDFNTHGPTTEGSCCECPTVELAGTMPSEDVKDGLTGSVAYKSELADEVKMYLADSYARDIDGKRAREFIKEKFNWDKCVERYEKAIGAR